MPPNNTDEAEEIPSTSGGGGQVTPPLPSASLINQSALLSQSLLPQQISSSVSVSSSSVSTHQHQHQKPIVNPSPPQSFSSVNINNTSSNIGSETYQNAQWTTAMMITSMMMNASGQQQTTQPSLYTAIASERQFVMQQLGCEPSEKMKGNYNYE